MIVVTGGAGFIGSRLVRFLNGRGQEEILLVDELTCDEKWKNLLGLTYADYRDKETFLAELSEGLWNGKIKAFYHLGACSATTETDSAYLMENNVRYTMSVLEWCQSQGVRCVYASSAATYGDGSQGYSDKRELFSQLRPLNMYGYSKLLADQWALKRGLLDNAVGLRYFNVFGPGEYHKGSMASLVLKAVREILTEGRLCLFQSHLAHYAHGEQGRDFIYVKDAVALTALAMEDKTLGGGVYNVGTGAFRTWNDLGRAVFSAMDRPENIEYIPIPEHIRGQYQYHTCADMSSWPDAHRSAICYSLEEAVTEYVRDYLLPYWSLRLGEELGA